MGPTNVPANQGYYMIQGAPKMGVPAPAFTPESLTWNNLSALMGPMVGPPTYDLNSQWVSSGSDATGTFVEANNLANTGGTSALWDGIQFDAWGTVTTIGGGFLNDWDANTQVLMIRGTIVERPAAAASMMMGLTWKQDNARQTLGFRNAVYHYTGNDRWGDSDGGSTVNAVPAPQLRAGTQIALSTSRRPNWVGVVDTASWSSNPLASFGTNVPRFALFSAFRSNTNTGPHVMKVLWEYALSDLS